MYSCNICVSFSAFSCTKQCCCSRTAVIRHIPSVRVLLWPSRLPLMLARFVPSGCVLSNSRRSIGRGASIERISLRVVNTCSKTLSFRCSKLDAVIVHSKDNVIYPDTWSPPCRRAKTNSRFVAVLSAPSGELSAPKARLMRAAEPGRVSARGTLASPRKTECFSRSFSGSFFECKSFECLLTTSLTSACSTFAASTCT